MAKESMPYDHGSPVQHFSIKHKMKEHKLARTKAYLGSAISPVTDPSRSSLTLVVHVNGQPEVKDADL